MLKKSLALVAMVLLASACSKKTSDTATDASLAGANGVGGTGIDRGGIASPGSQADLAQNVGDRVFFELDSSDINAESKSTLDRQAAWLKKYPQLPITIEGHADERGTREYNIALGERRANAVKSYLVALGVPSGRLQTISYGKERPAVVGSDGTSWAQNRRGVTVVGGGAAS